jgi:hypothetical protein
MILKMNLAEKTHHDLALDENVLGNFSCKLRSVLSEMASILRPKKYIIENSDCGEDKKINFEN